MIENKTTGLVAKSNVVRLCRYTLKRVEDQRAEDRKQIVAKHVTETNEIRKFFGFVIRRKLITHEEMEAKLKADQSITGGFEYYYVRHYYEKAEDTALRLLRLCKHTISDDLYVTAEDLDQLYEPKE